MMNEDGGQKGEETVSWSAQMKIQSRTINPKISKLDQFSDVRSIQSQQMPTHLCGIYSLRKNEFNLEIIIQ